MNIKSDRTAPVRRFTRKNCTMELNDHKVVRN